MIPMDQAVLFEKGGCKEFLFMIWLCNLFASLRVALKMVRAVSPRFSRS